VNSQWEITTDINDNSAYESFEGVMFFVPHGGVTFNGGSNTYLHAITCHNCGLDEALVGYLFYVPPTNTGRSRLTAAAFHRVAPSLPGFLITLEVLHITRSTQSQIIGYSVKIAGNSFAKLR
jgi:hypothetical protein